MIIIWFHDEFKMRSGCVLDVFCMRSECVLDAVWMQSGCSLCAWLKNTRYIFLIQHIIYVVKSTAHHNQTKRGWSRYGTPIRVGPKMSVTCLIVGLFASSAWCVSIVHDLADCQLCSFELSCSCEENLLCLNLNCVLLKLLFLIQWGEDCQHLKSPSLVCTHCSLKTGINSDQKPSPSPCIPWFYIFWTYWKYSQFST